MKANPEALKICVIGGGSRNWTWDLIRDLALENEIGGQVFLYDISFEAAKANEKIGNKVMESYNKGRWKFTAEASIDNGLRGSDFVLISILPGSFDDMAIDVHLPEKYGIYQSVGDTVGPGGLNRALRTVPVFQEIANNIRNWASEAWIINLTNPLSNCTRTLYKTFPEIKAFGCCHEVFGTQRLLSKVAVWANKAKADEIEREDVKVNVLGINHFTWIDEASYKNIDIFSLLDAFADEFAEKGFSVNKHEESSYFDSLEKVKLDLYRRYGILGAAGDRHLAEFCPPAWYLKDPETAASWGFSLTPVSWRKSNREELIRKSKAYSDGSEIMKPVASGEEGIKQIKALLGLGNLVTNVNLPNQGQMPDFPLESIVETNAVFSRNSIKPVITNRLPNPVRSLILQHVENHEGIIAAAEERDLKKAFRIFLNDPQVRILSREDAWKLFKEMTEKTLPPSLGYK
jgi:alpha-galactosidase